MVTKRRVAIDIFRLRHWQPKATDIRFEGRCDSCGSKGLYSYRLPNDAEHVLGGQACGYWCGRCGWANAGSRPIRKATGPRQRKLT
jgi:hypothetical protein